MSLSEFTALLVLCTAMSFSPGPNTTLSAALAANAGLRRALVFCVAVPVGWTGLMLACGLGLGALILLSPLLRGAVKWLGIAYLCWLALRLWRTTTSLSAPSTHSAPGTLSALGTSGTSTAPSGADVSAPSGLQIGFWEGVGMQFINVKAWMLALTLTGGWVLNAHGQPAPNPDERLLQVCAVMVAFAFASNATYALLGAALRNWLAMGRRIQVFNRAMALVLVATAVWLGLTV